MMKNFIKKEASARLTIRLPEYQRQQVDELIKRKVFTTINQAVGFGLDLLIRQYKLQRWDDKAFAEYEAGMLQRNPRTGVLLSRQFQKDLKKLVKTAEPQLRRGTWVVLRKIVHHFDHKKFPNITKSRSLNIKELETKNYYFADFEFRKNRWRILLRRQQKELIACQIGYRTDLVFI